MPTVTLTWRIKDDTACPICRALNGYTFGPYTDPPDSLIHPAFGEVWNTLLGSMAHDHQFATPSTKGGTTSTGKYGLISNCRCSVEPRFQLSDLAELIHNKRLEIAKEYGFEVEKASV
jgi:hypothetical protein